MCPPIPPRFPISLAEFQPPAQRPPSFNPDHILARLLEGDESEIPLSEALERQGGLSQALDSLPAAQVQRIQALCGDQYEALLALSEERNPDRFYENLVQIAQDLEDQDSFEMAGRIYQTVTALNHGVELSATRRTSVELARQRLELFSGRGAWGDRFEFLGRRILRDAVDPTMLVGMGVATLAYRSTRLAVLSRLFRPATEAQLARAATLVRPSVYYRSRAAFLSGVVGTNVEVLSYLAATRLTDELRGRPQDWSEDGTRNELRNAYLTFAGMHLGAALTSLLTRSRFGIRSMLSETEAAALELETAGARSPSNRLLEAAPRSQRLQHEVAVQAGMFSGIVLAHRAAEHLGIVPEHGRQADLLGDSLRFFIQASVMRALSAPLYRQQTLAMDRSLSGAGGPIAGYSETMGSGEGTE